MKPQKNGSSHHLFFNREREYMVSVQLAARGILAERVLQAMGRIPREAFVLNQEKHLSYRDGPLPIGQMQTISQPYIVAYMTEKLDLEPEHKVLEIGTGSGYQTAVLAACGAEVYSIEIIPELALRARHVLEEKLGYSNISFLIGDGTLGWPGSLQFDRILLTASPPCIPQTLVDQLKCGGKLLAPEGDTYQKLILLEKDETGYIVRIPLLGVRFVPMTGKASLESE